MTLQLGTDVLDYFEKMAEETGIPAQSLMNLYLRDCAASHRRLTFEWELIRVFVVPDLIDQVRLIAGAEAVVDVDD